MGKKPVLGLIGLVWAGIVLTGCGETSRNYNNPGSTGKYDAKPFFGARKDSPAAGGIPTAPSNSTQISDGRNTGATPMSKNSDMASTGEMGRGDVLTTSAGKGWAPTNGSVTGGPGGNPLGSGMGNGIPSPPSPPGPPQNVESLRSPQAREYPGVSGGTPPGQFRDVSSPTGINGGSEYNRVPVPNPPAPSYLNGGSGSRIGEQPPSSGMGNLPAIGGPSMSARPDASMGTPSVPGSTSGGSLPPMSGGGLPPPIPPSAGFPPPPGN